MGELGDGKQMDEPEAQAESRQHRMDSPTAALATETRWREEHRADRSLSITEKGKEIQARSASREWTSKKVGWLLMIVIAAMAGLFGVIEVWLKHRWK